MMFQGVKMFYLHLLVNEVNAEMDEGFSYQRNMYVDKVSFVYHCNVIKVEDHIKVLTFNLCSNTI